MKKSPEKKTNHISNIQLGIRLIPRKSGKSQREDL